MLGQVIRDEMRCRGLGFSPRRWPCTTWFRHQGCIRGGSQEMCWDGNAGLGLGGHVCVCARCCNCVHASRCRNSSRGLVCIATVCRLVGAAIRAGLSVPQFARACVCCNCARACACWAGGGSGMCDVRCRGLGFSPLWWPRTTGFRHQGMARACAGLQPTAMAVALALALALALLF